MIFFISRTPAGRLVRHSAATAAGGTKRAATTAPARAAHRGTKVAQLGAHVLPAGALGATLIVGGAVVSNAFAAPASGWQIWSPAETTLFARRENTVVTFDAQGREIRARESAASNGAAAGRARCLPGPWTPTRRCAWPAYPTTTIRPRRPKTCWSTKGSPATARRRLARRTRRGPGPRRRPGQRRRLDRDVGGPVPRARRRCTRAGWRVMTCMRWRRAAACWRRPGPTLFWRRRPVAPSFTVAAGLTLPPRALATCRRTAQLLVADDDGVLEIGPYGASAACSIGRPPRSPCAAAWRRRCTSDARLDLDAGSGAAARAGDRPPARMLACGASARVVSSRAGDGCLHVGRRRDLDGTGDGRGRS